MISHMRRALSPAFTPIAIASDESTITAAASRLFASFMTCAWPAPSPQKNTLPKFLSTASSFVKTGLGPDTMTASVPSFAPFMPPLTGTST